MSSEQAYDLLIFGGLAILFAYMAVQRPHIPRGNRPYHLIIVGLFLLTCGALIDVLDNLQPLDTIYPDIREFVKQVLCFLLGICLTGVGLALWVPAIVSLGDEMEERVSAQRALEDAREHLMFSLSRAEEASQAKSNFLATISHELRTPLNALVGYAEVLEAEMLGPIEPRPYRDYGRNMLKSARHMMSLVNELLDMERLQAGQQSLNENEVDVGTLVRDTVQMLERRVERAGITLTGHCGVSDLKLRADHHKLQQMLLNLVENSIKFGSQQGVVAIEAVQQDDGAVVISVADDGPGIPADRLEKVLEPFISTHNPMISDGGGLGLGLAITKKLIEAHGGRLDLTSQPGNGTVVTLFFPPGRTLSPVGQMTQPGAAA